MGDRMSAALADPRAVDKAGLVSVIEEQNQQLGDDGDRVPRMRLHSPVSKKGKRAGQETWTLYIEDRRGESGECCAHVPAPSAAGGSRRTPARPPG
jgi:hypothetical protein